MLEVFFFHLAVLGFEPRARFFSMLSVLPLSYSSILKCPFWGVGHEFQDTVSLCINSG